MFQIQPHINTKGSIVNCGMVSEYLFGKSKRLSVDVIGLSVAVSIALAFITAETGGFGRGISSWIFTGANFVVLIFFTLLASSIYSYINNGVLVAIFLASFPIIGLHVSGGLAFAGDYTVQKHIIYLIDVAILYGFSTGFLGYTIGYGFSAIQK